MKYFFYCKYYNVLIEYSRIFRTGDYAKIIKGSIIYEGRVDSQIKIRGHRVDLAEVEKMVSKVPKINKVIVLCYKPGELSQVNSFLYTICVLAYLRLSILCFNTNEYIYYFTSYFIYMYICILYYICLIILAIYITISKKLFKKIYQIIMQHIISIFLFSCIKKISEICIIEKNSCKKLSVIKSIIILMRINQFLFLIFIFVFLYFSETYSFCYHHG